MSLNDGIVQTGSFHKWDQERCKALHKWSMKTHLSSTPPVSLWVGEVFTVWGLVPWLQSLQLRWDITFIFLGSTGQRTLEEKRQRWAQRESHRRWCTLERPGRSSNRPPRGRGKQTGSARRRLWPTCGADPRPQRPGSWTNRLAAISAAAAAAPRWPAAQRGGTASGSPAGCRSGALHTRTPETLWPA